jgi:hypothetical protein
LHSVREWLRFIDFKLPGSFPVVPPASGSSKNRVKMQSQLMSPSKTFRKIDISKLFVHFVWECLRFIDFKLPGLQKSVKNTLGLKFIKSWRRARTWLKSLVCFKFTTWRHSSLRLPFPAALAVLNSLL